MTPGQDWSPHGCYSGDSQNEQFVEYIISDLKHSMQEAGLPAGTHENLWSSWGHTVFMLQHSQMTCGLVWGDNHAKDHVFRCQLPCTYWTCPDDPLIFGCYAALPFTKFLSALRQEYLSSQKEEGEQSEAVDPHGFSLVRTCLTRAGESVLSSISAMQGCRMTIPLP